MGVLRQRNFSPAFFLLLFLVEPIHPASPSSILWTAPLILAASLMIAWGAESAQFFMAQGFALAILAWLQTLPEFAVEGVFAWRQQTHLLMAGLTGALRLLTGFGWPVIYLTAAVFHRRRHRKPLRKITLEDHHSVEVVALLVPLLYIAVVGAKSSITVVDGAVLIAIYAAYLFILTKLPAEKAESVEELEAIPRAIVTARRPFRIAAISLLFAAGGFLIFYNAEPFVGSMLAIATRLGISEFNFVQWVAPVVSEFPEMASTVYFARTVERAPMALMNMLSSNINQWTLLVAMLPIVFSISAGEVRAIELDSHQRLELLLTLGQAVLGMMFLINMELTWQEASALFVLFVVPYAFPVTEKAVTILYFVWAGVEVGRFIFGKRKPAALVLFGKTWKSHLSR